MADERDFARLLLNWFDVHGRHDLPWQKSNTPYRVWVSEVMLQQTQVTTVIPYYTRFMQRFADVQLLADADIDEVLHYWTGLGYYARGRNLHNAARIICADYDGEFPDTLDRLMALPGIGRSTAGAILALASHQRHPILDGNVKRVLTRVYAVEGWPGQGAVVKQLWALAEELTPRERVADYTQAIMDLGATVCTRSRPDCDRCPVAVMCRAHAQGNETDYPTPKPRAKKPVRTAFFLFLDNGQGEILLQQRPPSGIWGGLWGVPECEEASGIGPAIRQLGFKPISERRLNPVRHTFSHFHLDINPVHCRVTEAAEAVKDDVPLTWYRSDGNHRLGLAAPVKKLLQTLELLNDTNGKLRKAG